MASIKLHSSDCGPCTLCTRHSRKYKQFGAMDSELQAIVNTTCGLTLEARQCICYACAKQLVRNKSNPQFKPRWLPNKTIKNCNVHLCKNPWRTNTIIEIDRLEDILGKNITAMSVDETVTTVGLCKEHYNTMYSSIHSAEKCAWCETKGKRDEKINRHCPQVEVINAHISTMTEEQEKLTAHSLLCLPCYKYFQNIVQTASSDKQQSQSLESVLITLKSTISSHTVIGVTDYLEYIMYITTKRVVEHVQNNEAILLSTVYKQYTTEALRMASHYLGTSMKKEDLPSRKWLVSRLHMHLENLIEIQCRHKRYGSIIFLSNCDLVNALSSALGKSQKGTIDGGLDTHSNALPAPSQSIEEQMDAAATHINKLLQNQAKELVTTYRNKPLKYSTFNIDTFKKQLNPSLLGFIEAVTRSVRETKRKLFVDSETPKTKNTRQLYALCVLLFTSNTACSMPFHVLLTEAILCNGGSKELVRIMNRVGAVASFDTANRLSTLVATERISKGIIPELHKNTLTVASIDNIDILQPFSLVSCTDATRSWHGTSVQCVQPRPSFNTLSIEETLPSNKHCRSSPINSPMPLPRNKRRRRTLTECPSPHTQTVLPSQPLDEISFDQVQYSVSTSKLSLSDFHVNIVEEHSAKAFRYSLFQSILLKKYEADTNSSKLPGLQSLLSCIQTRLTETEVSKVSYIEIRSEKADCKDTLGKVLTKLHNTFVISLGQKWLVVVGDAKTYTLLQSLRAEYGNHLKWLIPWPGDWHILLNYQKALMKAYCDAGLSTLGKIGGHKAETLTSLINCSNFRRTHNFLLQAFQSFYQYFISLYLSKASDRQSSIIKTSLDKVLQSFVNVKKDIQLINFRIEANDILSELPCTYTEFTGFMQDISKKQDTIMFWYNFITIDCFAYLALFDSIRNRNWQLRVYSLKLMGPFFSAMDRPTYQLLIPKHLQDLAIMPKCIIQHFEDGGFSARLSETDWHAVGLDECHEMLINKDAKMAVVRPNEKKMEFLSNHLQFSATCMKNLEQELFPENKENFLFTHKCTSKDKIMDANIEAMHTAIVSHGMFYKAPSNTGLWNFLENTKATAEQQQDLMALQQIGQRAYDLYIESKLINRSSTKAPTRKKRLCTFTVSKVEKKREKQIDRERKLSQRYMKRQITWLAHHGYNEANYDMVYGQISLIPRALVDNEGFPYKSTKCSTTHYLQKRYKTANVIIDTLPPQWAPDMVILEGMFMIQTPPIATMSNMHEYVKLLLNKYVKPHLKVGAKEVHVVFDNPDGLLETPKEIEHCRRDKGTDSQHVCIAFTSSTPVLHKWRSLLGCRDCKKKLTSFIASEMLKICHDFLKEGQKLFTNVRETAYSVIALGTPEPEPNLRTNADEGDLRVWLHSKQSTANKKLIFSPDTDVYHIGLPICTVEVNTTTIYVQLSKNITESPKFLSMNNLLAALNNDPDLACIPSTERPQSLQSLYACTGCDYISFFKGIGKVTFLDTFFQHASFIAGDSTLPGSIGNVASSANDPALYSFIRLVGCAYFKKHKSGFKLDTPKALYNSIQGATSTLEHHSQWLNKIREVVWERADNEEHVLPSTEALTLHWTRCLWVLQMWKQATENNINLPVLSGHGWTRSDTNGSLQVVWDIPANCQKVQDRLDYVLAGCKCKTGCSTRRCKCIKESRACGPGCRCISCENIPTNDGQVDFHSGHVEDELIESENSDSETENYHDSTGSIMEFVFGREDEY